MCSGTRLDSERDQLETHGFAQISGVLSSSRLEELTRALTGNGGRWLSRRGGDYAARNLLSDVPAVRELATSREFIRIAEDLLGHCAHPVRGILFDKVPEANWHVGWHQDTMIPVAERRDADGYGPWSVKAGLVHVKPPVDVLANMLTLRVHLDDCRSENGALRVLPGSHRHGFLTSDDVKEWIATITPVTCSARRGDVLAMRPLLLHASSRAVSASHRRVIHLEYAATALPGGLRWPELS